MRITVVARRDCTRDPHVQPLLTTLTWAGHDVTVLRSTPGDPGSWPGTTTRAAPRASLPARALRRLGGARAAGTDVRWSALLEGSAPVVQYATRADDLDLCDPDLSPIARQPGWTAPPNDLVTVAPAVSTGPATAHTPQDDRDPSHPAPGRHRGRRVVVAANLTPTNPSRYLIEALERAGVDVVAMDGEIDWDDVPTGTAGVLICESPYPVLSQRGTRSDRVPVLYWVHHGEHHLYANLRLTAAYCANAVLLAHSWHLAHRFPVPVHRFPFGIDPGLSGDGRAWEDRDLAVSMVAAGLDVGSPRHPRRAAWAERLGNAFGDTAFLRYGIPPARMAKVYGRSRAVLNDGGTKHFPITMRVFEAIGAGARLLTGPQPGIEQLFRPGEHFELIEDERIVDQVHEQQDRGELARAAHDHANTHHTYDHRVDELLAAFASTDPRTHPPAEPLPTAPGTLGALLATDIDVQTIASLGAGLDLPGRVVRHDDDAASRMPASRFDAVVVASTDVPADVLARAARRFVYADPGVADALEPALHAVHEQVTRTDHHDIIRFDLHAGGYRMRPDDHPLAQD